ncbi:hypothetical protein M0651_07605 [Paenibacillus sp. MBLB2552]|uniref:Uncharacterized protein n=1 Tax=Paenibacillus mellifer TaxID=2937794 RepID=A0A9X1XZX4_9BACL|nr:hypothetical protein [Paenibacillus mellifer]MCK8487031.1 hypothetical protein [Paenibacillus mellifer]
MAVFNRYFGKKDKIPGLWLIPILGSAVMFSTFFIPIGFHGTEGVESFIYVWISTADSMRMEFGFVERVIYIILLVYLSLSLLFITVTWHVGAELLKDAFAKKRWTPGVEQKFGWKLWIIIILFSTPYLFMVKFLDEKQFFELIREWLNLRYLSEIALVIIVFWLGRKAAK